MINGRNFFDQPVKNNLRTYDNIQKIATGEGGDYKSGCLLNYLYFKNCYKTIAIALSKEQELDADPKAIRQIDFARNLDRDGNTTMFFIIEKAKEHFIFSQGTMLLVVLMMRIIFCIICC